LLHITFPFGRFDVSDNLDLIRNGTPLHSQSRRLKDLLKVLLDPTIVNETTGETTLYKMYRAAVFDMHYDLFSKNILRFDITIMSPLLLGHELNKTMGHSHPEAVAELSFPEIYQVLYGETCFLLQKMEKGQVTEFKVVKAEPGDVVLIPPNYGHVSVNYGDSLLVLTNLVSDNFTSVYGEYLLRRGAAYYMLQGGNLIPNPRYQSLPEPIFSKEQYPVSKDLYTDFVSCPRSFSFLNDPTKLGKVSCRKDRQT